jgi:hypothetical protein
MLIKPLILLQYKSHAHLLWHVWQGNRPPARPTLIEHLTIRADDRPGIVSEGIVEEPMCSWEHAPRALSTVMRSFCVYPTYLEDLSTMR